VILLLALPDANIQDVYPQLVPAFGSCRRNIFSQLLEAPEVLTRSLKPNSDTDAVALKNLVLQEKPKLAEDEQIKFVAYSGGLTIALNAASFLEQKGIAVSNIVSIGGATFRNKPGNVGQWTAIWGSRDIVQGSLAFPDKQVTLKGPGHEDYFDSTYLPQILQEIMNAGVR
jgi:hypothetical protein